MFASKWLSETKILVNICQRKEVICKGYRASIAHPWAVAVYHQFALKSMLHNRGLHLATSSLVHSHNFPCSGLTWAVVASTLIMKSQSFCSSVYTVLTHAVYIGVQRFLCTSMIYKFGLTFTVWVHFIFLLFNQNKLDVERMFITGQEAECFSCNTPIKLMVVEYI